MNKIINVIGRKHYQNSYQILVKTNKRIILKINILLKFRFLTKIKMFKEKSDIQLNF